jgi:hypothetical protein
MCMLVALLRGIRVLLTAMIVVRSQPRSGSLRRLLIDPAFVIFGRLLIVSTGRACLNEVRDYGTDVVPSYAQRWRA